MAKLFAGLDVADQTTAICIINEDGSPVLQIDTTTTAKAIGGILRPYRRRLKLVGLESGNKAIWLHRELTRARFPMRCLDTRYAHAALGARINKTDTNDAQGLAELLARGIFTEAHVKNEDALQLRTLLILRAAMVKKALDLQSAVRMSRKAWGTEAGKRLGKNGSKSEDLSMLELRLADQSATRAIAVLNAEARGLYKVIVNRARHDDDCRRLMTIPGVGPITALAFVATIDDPTRFKRSRDVAAYLGLTPRGYQSGASSRKGGISKQGDPLMRGYLYSAAQVMLVLSRSNCRLRQWGLDLAKKRGNRLAYVACARKLAVLMHRLWIAQQDFDPSR